MAALVDGLVGDDWVVIGCGSADGWRLGAEEWPERGW